MTLIPRVSLIPTLKNHLPSSQKGVGGSPPEIKNLKPISTQNVEKLPTYILN
jgi:hypothetical protein